MTKTTYSTSMNKALKAINCPSKLNSSEEIKKEQGYTTYELFKIFNKLEQRISTLEKVLASHAKCIGEIREKKDE